MSRKAFFISLIALLIPLMVAGCFADPAAQLQQAEQYVEDESYEQAEKNYQGIIQQHGGTIWALEAQKELTIVYIAWGKQPEAQAAYEKLLADLTQHEVTAEDIYWIAKRFNWAKQSNRAAGVHRYNVERFPGKEHALWSQVEVIFHHIRSGDESASDTEVDRFLSIFAGHPALPRDVYNVAKEYDKAGRHRKALELYQYVIEHRPADEDIYARMSASMAYIGLADEANALAVTDGLISDFYDHSDLAGVVFHIGEQYYEKAFQAGNEALEAQAKENFEKALTVWEKIITDLPVSDPNTPKAYYFSAVCYRRRGEYEVAIEYYSIVLDNWPNYEYAWVAQFRIARCYEKLASSGRIPKTEAAAQICQACKKLLANYPESKGVKPALNLLEYWDSINSK